MEFVLATADEIRRAMGERARRLRLVRNWNQAELAARAGVSLASLRRFEATGRGAVELLVRVAQTLQAADAFETLLAPPVTTIAALAREADAEKRQRASRRSSRS